MFSNQGNDEGCGKWLTTKNPRRIVHSQKQKNARGAKKGKKKESVFKSDHLPGVVISSTPMPPRIIEMLSRVKQAKVERFFKPVTSKDQEDKKCESEDIVKNDDGGLGEEVLRNYKTPVLKRQHKTTIDQEELQLWEDDVTLNERHQNETDKLNISGVLPIDKSDNDSLAQRLHHSNSKATNQHQPVINSSPDDMIKSPVSKKSRCMTNESHNSPSSPFPSNFNDDYDERDSDSFHYTQWVNEQKRKSKELQGELLVSSQQETKLESSGRSSSSSSSNLNRKSSQDIGEEIFSDTESQFRFSQWALEQKAKCKRLQQDSCDALSSEERDNSASLHKNLKESKSSSQHPSDVGWTESNFQFTEWVKEQKTKSKEILECSSPESKEPPQTQNGMIEILNEDMCIPESEVFEEVESGGEFGWEYGEKGYLKGEIENMSKRDCLISSHGNPSSREALKDVSNEVRSSKGTGLKIERKHLREPFQKDTKEQESDNMTSPLQESEDFRYTEWTRNQRQICKQFHKDQEFPFKDDFWDISTVKNDAKSVNECQGKEKQRVLASDTDQESDSETSFMSLQN